MAWAGPTDTERRFDQNGTCFQNNITVKFQLR